MASSELEGKSIEVHISTQVLETHGFGKLRVEPHPLLPDRACLWVSSAGCQAFSFEQFEADQIQRHPDSSLADFVCNIHYEGKQKARRY